jgi:ketol-acid reductoisomerase
MNTEMKTQGTEMQAAEERAWEQIVQAGEKVAYAYQHVLKAADELADLLEYNADYVLRRALPKSVAERRDCELVPRWLEAEREEIEEHVRARLAAHAKAAQREALLARLKLTKAEQRLLGIPNPQEWEGAGDERGKA